MVLRPLSALSLVVPMFGVLGAVAGVAAAVAEGGCPNGQFREEDGCA